MLRYGVLLPLLGDLADPRTQAALGAEAEGAGWDGFFVLDDVDGGDAYVVLAAVACATTRVTLGVLDTPAGARPPSLVARQSATLDRLSGGRLAVGVGSADGVLRGREARHGDGAAADFAALAQAGAAWWLETLEPTDTLAYAYAMISAGPPGA